MLKEKRKRRAKKRKSKWQEVGKTQWGCGRQKMREILREKGESKENMELREIECDTEQDKSVSD